MTRTLAALLVLLSSLPVFAQDFESYSGMHIRFDAAGARGRAMGGAALAMNDVFSVTTNPASIASTKRRTAAIEGRYTSTTATFLTDDRFPFTTTTQLDSSRTRVSSALVVAPASRGVYSFFYDEPLAARVSTLGLDYRFGTIASVGVRPNGDIVDIERCTDCIGVYFNVPAAPPMNANIAVRRIGTAGAWQAGAFAFGAALRYEMLDQHSAVVAPGGNFVGISQQGDDAAFSYTAGVQWQPARAFRAAASYQSGTKFDITRLVPVPIAEPPFPPAPRREADTFNTPATYGVGFSIEPTRNLTIAADAVRVRYSEMIEGVEPAGSPLLPWVTFAMPDVTEIHAGAEYRIGNVALRAGWWRDPMHRMRAIGHPQVANALNLTLLDEDEDHVTAGIGFAVSERLRIDAALDRGDRSTRASLGVTTTF